ncbi:MAG: hypothetical protein R2912_07010 [Eubacteriales bacterium]
MSGVAFTSGSAGTMSAGDYLKEGLSREQALAVGEALQCSTLLNNGFGGTPHRRHRR